MCGLIFRFCLGENHSHPRRSALHHVGSAVIPRARKVDGLNPSRPTLGGTRRDGRRSSRFSCGFPSVPGVSLPLMKEEWKVKACNVRNGDGVGFSVCLNLRHVQKAQDYTSRATGEMRGFEH